MKYLLCAINLFSEYTWVVRGITIATVFQKIISEGKKTNQIWVDQCGELYNNLFKRFLEINNIKMYSTYKKGNSVVAERFIKTLKNKHMTAVSNSVYFDVLDDIFDKYNNTVYRTIKIKPIDVTSNSYAEYNEDANVTKPKLKVGHHVRISKYNNIFAKRYTQNWSEEVSVASKIKNTVPRYT